MKSYFTLLSIVTVLITGCTGYTTKDGKVYLKRFTEANMKVTYSEVDADFETFEVIDHDLNIDLGKDKDYVYLATSILVDADPNSFSQIKNYYWKDHQHVFLIGYGGNNCMIPEADPNSFQVIENYLWARDKDNLYYRQFKLDIVNPNKFNVIDENWGKDDTHYYWHSRRVDSLDYNHAHILSSDYIADKRHIYFKDKLVQDANPLTFKVDGVGSFGHDDKNMFDGNKNRGPITEEYRKIHIDKK